MDTYMNMKVPYSTEKHILFVSAEKNFKKFGDEYLQYCIGKH